MTPATYSLVAPAAVQQLIHSRYKFIEQGSVTFIHQGIHDTYLVTTSKQKFIFRLYRHEWKNRSSIEEELEALQFLRRKDISVSYPMTDSSNSLIQLLECAEGMRYAVLFQYAEGTKPELLDESSAELFGRTLAVLHKGFEGFEHPARTNSYTPEDIVRRTIHRIANRQPTMLDIINATGENILSLFPKQLTARLTKGTCHGDPHHENIHIQDGVITFFDFDFVGQGFLLYDIGSFARYERERPQNINAFLKGYTSVCTMTDLELKLISRFTLLMRFFHLGARAANCNGIKNPLWPVSSIKATATDIDNGVLLEKKVGM
jgi:Ser/Thr protein kinase RdoA (MazF antagonist)